MKAILFFLALLFILSSADTSYAQWTQYVVLTNPSNEYVGSDKAGSQRHISFTIALDHVGVFPPEAHTFRIRYYGGPLTFTPDLGSPVIAAPFGGSVFTLGPAEYAEKTFGYTFKFPTSLGQFYEQLAIEDVADPTLSTLYRIQGTVVPGVGINDYIQMRSSAGIGPATFSPIKGSPSGCPFSFCMVEYLAQFFDYDGSGSTAKSWAWKIELYHAKGTYELPVSAPPWNSKYSDLRIYAPFTLPPDYDWSRDANGNILTKVQVDCIDSEGWGHHAERMVGINYPPDKTRGTLACVNGTPLANKSVTVEFWDSTRKVASQSTKTDSAGAFEVTLLGFTSNHIQERLVISSGDCSWTLRTNRYYGDLGKLMCKECGGCVKAPEFLEDWWSFDETSGAVATDVSGYANQATLSGSPTHSSGKVSGALCFDGQSSFATVKDHAEINFAGDCRNDAAEAFTIDAWVRTSAAGLQVILDKRETRSDNFLRGYSLFIDNGRLGFQMATGPGNFACDTPGSACANYLAPPGINLSDGQWHFIAVTVSRCRGATGNIYVDGNLILTFQPLVGDISNQVPLLIGRQQPIPSAIYFDGCIDELEFFKTVLSKTDIYTIYNVGAFGKCKPRTFKDNGRRFEIGTYFSFLSLNRPQGIIVGHMDVGGIVVGHSDSGGIIVGHADAAGIIVGHFDSQGIIVGHQDQSGIGVRFTYNATPNVALEAAANFFPKRNPDLFVPGGRVFQMQFGVKVGRRFEKFGIFGKARPGLIRFSEVNRLVSTQTFIVNPALPPVVVGVLNSESKTYFSTDVGGVVEYYPSPRIVIRFDLGDTIIRYGPRAGFSPSSTIIQLPAETKHNLQFSAGVGFRF